MSTDAQPSTQRSPIWLKGLLVAQLAAIVGLAAHGLSTDPPHPLELLDQDAEGWFQSVAPFEMVRYFERDGTARRMEFPLREGEALTVFAFRPECGFSEPAIREMDEAGVLHGPNRRMMLFVGEWSAWDPEIAGILQDLPGGRLDLDLSSESALLVGSRSPWYYEVDHEGRIIASGHALSWGQNEGSESGPEE